jgi:hypothetical protein
MRKLLLFAILLLALIQISQAQTKLTGSYIKTKVTYRDGVELEDDMELKFSYLKYSFEPKQVHIAVVYNSKGNIFDFTYKKNILQLKNEMGYVINEFLVEKNTADDLVLIQKGKNGFDDDNCLRYQFIAENKYVADYHAASEDILSITEKDTVFISNSKLYPTFIGNKDYFDALKDGMPEQASANMYFLATYIVRKNGEADSLTILESISPAFDKQIVKNFEKTRKNWQPATYHGKPVSVQMKSEYRYFSSATMLPTMDHNMKGSQAMKNKDYSSALYYFNLGLDLAPDNKEMLYKRAVCEHELGNTEAACKDLNTIKSLGDVVANELLLKWCK